MVKPKVALPRVGSFNEIVTLNLNKYVLWYIDACTKFVQGKLLINKKVDKLLTQ